VSTEKADTGAASAAGRAATGRAPERSFWSGYDVMWGVVPETVPRRGTGLDRTTIVRAAVAIDDAEGMDAVTMRRVAERLTTGPMSLYRYVSDKDALVSMMVDQVISESGPEGRDELPSYWRDALRLVAESIWDVCQAHPWYPEAIMVRPPLTPNGAAGLELCLSIFDGYDGLDIGTKMLFVGMIQYSVVGAALLNVGEGRTREQLDMTEEQVMEQSAPFMKALVDSGRYPRVVEFITQAEHISEKQEVMRNVDLILDGIATRLPER
jgi:AcrR family transcriptional regulator